MKINLGSNNKIIGEDFKNVDVLPLENVDIVHDLTKFPYPFENESVDEIVATEFLEHISFRKTEQVLKECYRILKTGGKIHIQVPDIDAMMRYYVNDEICSCIPHKPRTIEDIKANPNCENCGGKGRVNPVRWLYAFTGAQKHGFDAHLNIFTPKIMLENLRRAGFGNIEFETDLYGWKIKCNCIK